MLISKINFNENKRYIGEKSIKCRLNTLSCDTFELSFGRNKKLSDDEKTKKTACDKLCKSLKKFGVGEKDLETLRKCDEIVQRINDYEKNPFKKGLNRKITPYEAYNIVLNNYGNCAQTYLNLVDSNTEKKTPFSRTISRKEMPYFVKDFEGDYQLIQRYMNFVDGDENSVVSRGEIVNLLKRGYTDTQLEVYSELRKCDLYKYDMSPVAFNLNKVTDDSAKCNRFKQLRQENKELTSGDAFALAEGKFDDNQVKTYIEYMAGNKENGKSSVFSRNIAIDEAYFAAKNGLDREMTQKLMDINDDWNSSFLGNRANSCLISGVLAKCLNEDNSEQKIETYRQFLKCGYFSKSAEKVIDDEKLLKRFWNLRKGENTSCPKPLSAEFACCAVIKDLNDEKAEVLSSAGSEEDPLNQWDIVKILENDESYEKYKALKKKATDDGFKHITDGNIIFMLLRKFSPKEQKDALSLFESGISRDSVVKLLKILPYKNVESTDELTRREKKDFIKLLIKPENFDLFSEIENKDLEGYKIIPKNQEEYSEILSKLVNEINEDKKIDSAKVTNILEALINGTVDVKEAVKSLKDMYVDFSEQEARDIDFDTCKNVQNLVLNPKFREYSDTDKKVLLLAMLFKSVSGKDSEPTDSAFDTYYFLKNSDIDSDSQLKIYELIKSQNFVERAMANQGYIEKNELARENVAFDLRRANTFEMAKLLYETENAENLPENYDVICRKIGEKLAKIKKTQIFIPQSNVPKASEMKNVETKTADGITNKVLYVDEADEDLSKYGFEKGITKSNWKSLVHALDVESQLKVFSTFGIIDSDALISSSYIGVNDYRVFRKQGVLIESDSNDIHAAYFCDFGSGYKKNINSVKCDYIFAKGNRLQQYRTYIPNLLKKEIGIKDDEYVSVIEKIQDCKTYSEIAQKDEKLAKDLENIFNNFASEHRKFGRKYNEILVTRPKIKGVFAYDKAYEDIPLFLRKYAQDNDFPVLIFGKKQERACM